MLQKYQCAAQEMFGLHKSRRALNKSLIEGAYFAGCRSGETEGTKAPERNRVLRFLLDYHSAVRPRLFTNPGANWIFERQVERELGEYIAYFIGVERSWQILEWGLRWMPGRKKVHHTFESFKESTQIVMTPKASILWANIEYIVRQIYYLKNDHLKVFKSRPYRHLTRSTTRGHLSGITGSWIDIWSPLGRPEIALFLRNLPKLFHAGIVPFAFTFQYGRDHVKLADHRCEDKLDARAEAIKGELEYHGGSFSVTDVWWYFGLNETRLATVCGTYMPPPGALECGVRIQHRIEQCRHRR